MWYGRAGACVRAWPAFYSFVFGGGGGGGEAAAEGRRRLQQ